MALLLLRHRARVRGSPAGCGALWAREGANGAVCNRYVCNFL